MLQQLLEELAPKKVKLVAVSKTRSAAEIMALYNQGQRIFGENRVQELQEKEAQLPKDIEWHMIGHLQSNKVKYIAPFVHLIHSVDSFNLLEEINKRAAQHNRCINYLLQFHIAREQSKSGFSLNDVKTMLESADFKSLKHVKACGVMGMATFTDDKTQVKKEFQNLKNIYDELKETYFATAENFKEISMGMSGDYQLAIAEGSTMVRIGSLLFGARV